MVFSSDLSRSRNSFACLRLNVRSVHKIICITNPELIFFVHKCSLMCFVVYSQKFVSPTVQLIMENSNAAPNRKKAGKKRYIPIVFLPGHRFSMWRRRALIIFITSASKRYDNILLLMNKNISYTMYCTHLYGTFERFCKIAFDCNPTVFKFNLKRTQNGKQIK